MTIDQTILTPPQKRRYLPYFDDRYTDAVDFFARLPIIAEQHGAPAPSEAAITLCRGAGLPTKVRMRLHRDVGGRGLAAWHKAIGGSIAVGRIDLIAGAALRWMYLTGTLLSGVPFELVVSVPLTADQVEHWFARNHGDPSQWSPDLTDSYDTAMAAARRDES